MDLRFRAGAALVIRLVGIQIPETLSGLHFLTNNGTQTIQSVLSQNLRVDSQLRNDLFRVLSFLNTVPKFLLEFSREVNLVWTDVQNVRTVAQLNDFFVSKLFDRHMDSSNSDKIIVLLF